MSDFKITKFINEDFGSVNIEKFLELDSSATEKIKFMDFGLPEGDTVHFDLYQSPSILYIRNISLDQVEPNNRILNFRGNENVPLSDVIPPGSMLSCVCIIDMPSIPITFRVADMTIDGENIVGNNIFGPKEKSTNGGSRYNGLSLTDNIYSFNIIRDSRTNPINVNWKLMVSFNFFTP